MPYLFAKKVGCVGLGYGWQDLTVSHPKFTREEPNLISTGKKVGCVGYGNGWQVRTVSHPKFTREELSNLVSHEQPLVAPQVTHFMQVPLRTSVKLPHSPQASPS